MFLQIDKSLLEKDSNPVSFTLVATATYAVEMMNDG